MANSSSSPLREIPFPQKTSGGDAPLMIPASRSGSTPTKSGEKFDLMDIEITVYSLTGINCSSTASAEKQENRRGRGEGRMIKSRGVFADESSNIPITGVVSFRRNVVSSGTMIETFLPSQILKLPQPKPGTVSRQTASWTSIPSTLLNPESNPSYATYSVKRVMQRQSYRRDLSIRDVANYAPETVEVKVGVGRGKEVIPLGAASIAITGEEEGESFTNVPVKDFVVEQGKRKTFRPKAGRTKLNRKKKRRAPVLSGDPSWCFSLAENATLRVGVKVTPTDIKESCEKVSKATEKTLDEILEGLYDENLIIELSDENSLLDRFLGQPEQENENTSKKSPTHMAESQLSFANFLCGMIPTCANMSTVDDTLHDDAPPEKKQLREEIKVGSKKTEAIVLSLSLMSSVSESTFGSEIETPVSNPHKLGFDPK